jgi:hypothetical protein
MRILMTMDQKFLLEVSMYKPQINKLMEMDQLLKKVGIPIWIFKINSLRLMLMMIFQGPTFTTLLSFCLHATCSTTYPSNKDKYHDATYLDLLTNWKFYRAYLVTKYNMVCVINNIWVQDNIYLKVWTIPTQPCAVVSIFKNYIEDIRVW